MDLKGGVDLSIIFGGSSARLKLELGSVSKLTSVDQNQPLILRSDKKLPHPDHGPLITVLTVFALMLTLHHDGESQRSGIS